MAKGSLFQYAVLYHPKKKEKDEVEKKSTIIVEPKTILAGTPDEVAMMAARAIPEDYTDKLDQVEIVVRPF